MGKSDYNGVTYKETYEYGGFTARTWQRMHTTFSYNSVINTDGISLGLGYIDSKGDNHTYSLDMDWLTIGKVALTIYLKMIYWAEIAVLGSVLVKLLVGA